MINQDCQSGLIGQSSRGGAGCPNCPGGPGDPSGPSGSSGPSGQGGVIKFTLLGIFILFSTAGVYWF